MDQEGRPNIAQEFLSLEKTVVEDMNDMRTAMLALNEIVDGIYRAKGSLPQGTGISMRTCFFVAKQHALRIQGEMANFILMLEELQPRVVEEIIERDTEMKLGEEPPSLSHQTQQRG